MQTKTLIVAGLLAAASSPVIAKDSLEVGLGAQFRSTAYAGYDDSARAIPLLSFDTTWFYADGAEIGVKALDKGPHRIGIFVTISEEEWDAGDSDDFKAFDDKDRAFHVGASYRYKAKWGVVKAKYFTDVSDEHEGNGGAISYAYPWKVSNKFMVIPSIKYKYLDEDYANYYYGISARDAATTAGVEAYDTGSASKITLGVMTRYAFTKQWAMYAGANYTMLDSDLEDSPLLDDDKETSFILGAAYKFW
ncbi:MipA/OmpV family protein [Corallincola platygyrae]|uniref:MipA/OmpV family protein n=1 Tax=Corallincola platygyrae TaxID=1193278 RepID=A0ABW4XMS3_9GAMM